MNLTSVPLFHIPKCGNNRPESLNLGLQISVFILHGSVFVHVVVYLCLCRYLCCVCVSRKVRGELGVSSGVALRLPGLSAVTFTF